MMYIDYAITLITLLDDDDGRHAYAFYAAAIAVIDYARYATHNDAAILCC